jgi:hypothetical protein
MSILGKIFGSDSVVSKGLGLIDELWTSGEERADNKIKLLEAYAPFKLAQRYLAFSFAGVYLGSYLLVLAMFLLGYETIGVTDIMGEFQIGGIMFVIVAFYFSGGVVDSIKRKNG